MKFYDANGVAWIFDEEVNTLRVEDVDDGYWFNCVHGALEWLNERGYMDKDTALAGKDTK